MMRPCVGVRPQERAVIYSDLESGKQLAVSAITSTNYMKVTWWDGTSEIVSPTVTGQGYGLRPKSFRFKITDTSNRKKIIIESCDSSGKLTGNITLFACDGRRKSSNSLQSSIEWISESRNQKISSIDVSTCIQLKVLKCDKNNLSSLGDIQACKNLKTLAFSKNNITSFDASKLPNLEKLYCNQNTSLSSLTIGENLRQLEASSCAFTSLTIPPSSSLIKISLRDSKLTGITLNNAVNLRSVGLQPYYNYDPYDPSYNGARAYNVPQMTTIVGNSLSKLGIFIAGTIDPYNKGFTATNLVTSIRLLNSGGSFVDNIGIDLGDFTYYFNDQPQWCLSYCNLTATALNTLYSDLNIASLYPFPININSYSVPGLAGSNTSIAVAKNYFPTDIYG